MNAWVIGGGLAAATCCHALHEEGWVWPHVFEKEAEWGGLVRSRRLKGVIYEPNGSHILHTDDEEVWNLANSLVPFRDYQHSVTTVVRGKGFTWPLQMDELEKAYSPRIGSNAAALSDLSVPGKWVDRDGNPARDPTGKNFEEWCLEIMPREVYEDFVKSYTEKQWGREATELSADFAPKRVQVRRDGDKRLFKDRFQGYPDGRIEFGWDDLVRELFGGSIDSHNMHVSQHVQLRDLELLLGKHPQVWRPELVVVTVPLDDFADFELGHLSWRGLRFEKKWVDKEHVLPGMVVNYPGKEFAWIRQHEAKWASAQQVRGTVVVTEFPGGEGRYYPVPGKDGADRARNVAYMDLIRERIEALGPKVIFTGRLSTFRYLDTDEVMREALDAVRLFTRDGDTISSQPKEGIA